MVPSWPSIVPRQCRYSLIRQQMLLANKTYASVVDAISSTDAEDTLVTCWKPVELVEWPVMLAFACICNLAAGNQQDTWLWFLKRLHGLHHQGDVVCSWTIFPRIWDDVTCAHCAHAWAARYQTEYLFKRACEYAMSQGVEAEKDFVQTGQVSAHPKQMKILKGSSCWVSFPLVPRFFASKLKTLSWLN